MVALFSALIPLIPLMASAGACRAHLDLRTAHFAVVVVGGVVGGGGGVQVCRVVSVMFARN